MKKINETRINNTANYIKDYFALHGECPTYREIKENLDYSSLSLVSADINKLKERGILVDDGFKHIKLTSQKEERTRRFDYPFLIMCDASNHEDLLNDEEKKLLSAQDNYLKGNYELAQEMSKELLKDSNDLSIMFGAKLTLCWSSICTGHIEYWKDFFKTLLAYQTKNISEVKEKELITYFFTSILKAKEDNCPKWIDDGRFYKVRNEAFPLATLLFVSRAINTNQMKALHMLEPICSFAYVQHIDVVQVYLDLYLAIAYHYAGNDEFLDVHLNGAIKTCVRHGWLIPLAEVRKTLGSVMCPILDEYDETLVERIDNLIEHLASGYNKIHQALVGDNPNKHFTFREVEIINFIHMNYSNKEIADKLYLSPETVKYYLSSIYLKLGVSGRKELKEAIKQFL
ncbi:MAG: LuxR C-terminal-related transcriptional regulator [Bacilli bacterium]|nr:LuxR C-terminal-related transcriptional regulator [Bacilli bacterium]